MVTSALSTAVLLFVVVVVVVLVVVKVVRMDAAAVADEWRRFRFDAFNLDDSST